MGVGVLPRVPVERCATFRYVAHVHTLAQAASYVGSRSALGPSSEERLAAGQARAEHPHLGDPAFLEPVDEGVVLLEGAAVPAQHRALPLRRPVAVGVREELIELHIASGQLHDRADDSEVPVDATVVPYLR